jgi:hypothetical protein
MGAVMTLPIHPVAALFPMLDEEELQHHGQLDQIDIRVTFFAGRWAISVDDGDSVTAGTGATIGEAYKRYTQALP